MVTNSLAQEINLLNTQSLSDIGKGRANNEDYFLVDESSNLFILADGIGGHNYGEVASKKACQIVKEKFDQVLTHGPITESEQALALVKFAIYSANRSIYQMALDEPIYKGMGTTLLVVFKFCDHWIVGHVGDSRFYKLEEDLSQLTQDHTILASDSPKSRSLRAKHFLTKSVGIKEFIEPSISIHPYNPKATYLLCSDGLSDYLDHQKMVQILKTESNLDLKASKLLQAVLETPAKDNITFILMNTPSP
jgi:protein phosphatase